VTGWNALGEARREPQAVAGGERAEEEEGDDEAHRVRGDDPRGAAARVGAQVGRGPAAFERAPPRAREEEAAQHEEDDDAERAVAAEELADAALRQVEQQHDVVSEHPEARERAHAVGPGQRPRRDLARGRRARRPGRARRRRGRARDQRLRFP
jgi:hypothetical protein